uniref:Ribosomal protein S7 n=1 Tax=Pseudo-nitzschia pungens TaxID=37318 RepID=A0A7T8E6K6_9STRA|nr:ribosomal protein S7 [Pseudo-nitzschia pungens]QQO80602.1 ribosomal protein S7 [Pseudo-nitzschia pungens]
MGVRNRKAIVLKNRIVNIFMKNGKKRTGEKILLKSSKLLQKSSKKNFQNLVQLAIINTTSAFKINEQVMKKGKRKSKKITPSFIVKDSLRIMTALKFIKSTVQKNKSSNNFYKNLANEVLASFSLKSQSIEQKAKLQTQILLNKRYLSKFKW